MGKMSFLGVPTYDLSLRTEFIFWNCVGAFFCLGDPQTGLFLSLKGRIDLIVTACFLSPSQVNNAVLLTHGALPTLALLLLDLAGALQRMDDVGLELVRERIHGSCFTLCLYVSAVSLPFYYVQLVFAACMPRASVSKQPVNRSASGGHGTASGAWRRATFGSLIYLSPVLRSETACLATRGPLAPQQPHWYLLHSA